MENKPTQEQIKEVHDCSNCRFSKQVAPYKVLLECEIDMETKIQPCTCNRWEGLFCSGNQFSTDPTILKRKGGGKGESEDKDL